MNQDFGYYVFVIIAIVVGFIVIKKVTSCLFKTIAALVLAAIIVAVYFMYIR